MSKHLGFLGFVYGHFSAKSISKSEEKYTEQEHEIKLAQLEEYLTADDNQGISNLALYLYS
ncbi:hypothetical protein IQ238_21950 [Pleurocapsales cyanobacterium LEGE 06147]|nr:hypothetical protein [Pleurocapsales cyanobacterium LEGE 06147]